MDKNFSETSNEEVVKDLMAAAKRVPFMDTLRKAGEQKNWCCALWTGTRPVINFSNGTSIRIHYCPRCGREL